MQITCTSSFRTLLRLFSTLRTPCRTMAPCNLYKITLPPHTNQTMEVKFMPAFRRPVVSLVCLSLHFSTLTRNIPQTLQISIAPCAFNRLSLSPHIEIFDSEPESDDDVGLGPDWPGPGPSRLRPMTLPDDVIVIDTESESDPDSEETIQVICFSPLFPGSIPYPNRKRSWTRGRESSWTWERGVSNANA